MKAVDPAALDCLAALADEGSFERAAQRLAITQSAVSQRLRALETQVGQLLVVRSRPLRLTDPGMLLRGKAKSYLQDKFASVLDPKKSLDQVKGQLA